MAAIGMCALAGGLLVASILTDPPKELPEVAFGWGFGLVIFRAAAAFAVIATLAAIVVRGWGGLWPRGISTTGVDYASFSEGSQELGQAKAKIRDLTVELEAVKTSQRSGYGQ